MNIEIANRLQQMRKKNNLSQEELAAKIGVSRQAVSKWERAESSPDTENLILLAKLYGVSIDELLNTEAAPEAVSSGISLKKDDYGCKNESVREVRPDTYTEKEIYPNPAAETMNNSIPQGAPFGADIDEEEKKASDARQENFGQTIERAGRAIGDVINAAGQKIGEGIKNAENEYRKGEKGADNWEEKLEKGMEKFEQEMEKFGDSMNRMGRDFDRKMNDAFGEKHKACGSAEKPKKEREPATLLDKLFPVIVTFLFFCSIPLGLAHPGWTLFLLIPLYYTTKEAVKKRNIMIFCYPVLCAYIYLTIGGLLDVFIPRLSDNWYGLMWLIFLTIPLFYTVFPAIKKRNPLIFCYPVLCAYIYLTIGGLLDVFIPRLSDNWYGLMWLIFLTIPLFYTVFPAIKKRNPLIFCYPVLCVLVYLGVGILLDMFWGVLSNWWLSIMWAPIFLSIPVYYIVLSHYRKNKNV